jgi:hypothetical protein
MTSRQCVTTCFIFALLSSCGSSHKATHSALNEAIDGRNAPQNITGAGIIDDKLDSLPTRGTTKPIWHGDWWPLSEGGTARRSSPNELSPLEKYDLVTNQNSSATQWERARARQFGDVSWAGHCNGLASAAMKEPEPRKNAVYNGVTFTPDDVKGLLVEMWQGGGKIVGGRCQSNNLERDSYGRPIDPHCRDLNPGTLHLALTNFVGKNRISVILDVSNEEEVWNFAVSSFESAVRKVTKEEALRILGLNGSNYPFHATASQFANVSTTVRFASQPQITLQYILELNAEGRILGGEWSGNSKKSHPDFIWRPDSSPNPENPHINPEIVRQIARLSY